MICFTNDIGFVDHADASRVSYAGGARTSHTVRTPFTGGAGLGRALPTAAVCPRRRKPDIKRRQD